ncbi:hypothetical protein COW36_00265 [bacterium (Candidatus Blackallbacteria) CG17_big_fil_post_rev_8_21_14_2_50_48_46]|uniref:Uncharacterized protein n=1 Tax=bacterium (Candidatus Blackallbacteria) CG17_big_fil_post_rev_8_21_14_2_50_48_46 TaxID=2014261 RepID=A0A2M7GAV1_9BACT|nr:MAG: hypothetical protein COW64_10905 [bacterium (Candidatus Blackallbacteria) CG18_big_fil_WC_8_21_14_2_50_49_26]PIW19309.1 MAG: hypothetical protein COW36_00265 [bacterium (Candidatus Blackallbacteria) CG17_big_fil_post_rev_8_21_14_2_50_48_46]PIW49087.1 MAG: hypothetical protein COW20_08190 [bacterium (Candidatus Blackallbacteria) CG13_big_fil_rev_8_21_14_2_50_49_14]
MIFPLLALLLIFSSFMLYFTLKFFNIAENRFGTALKVNLLSFLGSLFIGLLMGLAGMFIPIIPQIVGTLAPFALYLYLLQKSYALSVISGILVFLIQGIATLLMGLALFLGVLLPLGLSSAILKP